MTLRTAHFLSQLNKHDLPSNIIFFDTETSQQRLENDVYKHTLKLGYALHTRTTRGKVLHKQSDHVIKSIPDFWEWVDRKVTTKGTLYIVSHNLNYDLPILHGFSTLQSMDYRLTSFYHKAMLSVFVWERDNGVTLRVRKLKDGSYTIEEKHDISKIIAVDNSNFYQGKLEKWGDIVNVPKMEIDFETTDETYLLSYCKNDVEILHRLWLTWFSFLRENKLGGFRQTVSATALSAYRTRFLNHPIHIHSNQHALDLERDAYHGGRVECLFKGSLKDRDFYYLDVNSMYGYVMANFEYPSILFGYNPKPTMKDLEYRLNTGAVIARVMIEPAENYYPYVLFGHTIYPLGEFTTVLTTPELKLALEKGWIKDVMEFSYYGTGMLFADFVNHFYALRAKYKTEKNDGFATICKLLVNSLYGKFGQRGFVQVADYECDPDMVATIAGSYDYRDRPYLEQFIGGTHFESYYEGEAYNSFPAIAAHVTAYARMHLNSLRSLVPHKHVYYMDTDSLIVDHIGLSALQPYMSDDILGHLKIETHSRSLVINAPKDYAMGDRVRSKGISALAKQLDQATFLQTRWPKIAGMIRSGELDDYYTYPQIKRLKRLIYSGIVQPSGYVIPHRL